MKKHLVLTFFFAFAAIFTAQTQSLTSKRKQTPEVTVQKIRQVTEEQFDIFNNRDDDRNCDKCQKQKKSKKHNGCDQRGNHYGKHKNRGKDSCSHQCCCCESRKSRDCDDDDHWSAQDDADRRYTSDRRDRDDEYRTQPKPSQRKPTSTAKVKTRPTPTAKPTSTRPGAKKTMPKRPVGTRW